MLSARRVDFLAVASDGPPPPFGLLQFLTTLEAAGRHLDVTVESMEKALGAADAAEAGSGGAAGIAERRAGEARAHAVSASYVLDALGERAHGISYEFLGWLPREQLKLRPVGSLWEELSPGELGALLAAGVDPEWLRLPLGEEVEVGEEVPLRFLPQALEDAGLAGFQLATELRRWAESPG